MGNPDAAQLLQDRLAGLVAAIRDAAERVRQDDPDGVHDLRVAMRRTRSLLTTFTRELGEETCGSLRQDLRWAGGELSPLRDLEVVEERLHRLLGEQRVELVLGNVAARVDDHVRGLRTQAAPAVDRLLEAPGWEVLLSDLDRLGADEPDADEASLRKRLRKDWRRLRRRAARAAETVDERGRENALHDVRKAAKRARYAAETVHPLFGTDAARLEQTAEAVQEALGDHRDTVLTRHTLRDLGVQAFLDGDNGFTYGRLHALEEIAAAAALADYERVHGRLGKGKLVDWLG